LQFDETRTKPEAILPSFANSTNTFAKLSGAFFLAEAGIWVRLAARNTRNALHKFKRLVGGRSSSENSPLRDFPRNFTSILIFLV
jgi:hypothetical protein